MKYRLINCEFVSSSAFRRALSNKAQLLYYQLLVNTDDRGFVGNAKELTDALKITDTNNELLSGYDIALAELETQGYIYIFKDNHNNKIVLVRHFYIHNNKLSKNLPTNYSKFLNYVELIDDKYTLGNYCKGKPLKERNRKEGNGKEEKSNNIILNDIDTTSYDKVNISNTNITNKIDVDSACEKELTDIINDLEKDFKEE